MSNSQKNIFLLVGLFLFILNIILVSGVNLNNNIVFNTSISNSSVTFSVNATANYIIIYSNSIYFDNVTYVENGTTKNCVFYNHSINNNIDILNMNCVAAGGGGGGGGGGIELLKTILINDTVGGRIPRNETIHKDNIRLITTGIMGFLIFLFIIVTIIIVYRNKYKK